MTDFTQHKTKLKKILADITTDLQELGIHNPQVPEDWIAVPHETIDPEPDENIAADRREDWQERRATVATLETRYNNIVRALQKIEDGIYGVCEICNQPIEMDRLTVNPAARTDKAHLNDEANLPR